MSQSKWIDLPHAVQLEIFTFLSVKHLSKILSLSKSIQEQLNESEYFWQGLSYNYARVINDETLMKQTSELMNDQAQLSIGDKYSKHFEYLVTAKKEKIKKHQLTDLIFQNRTKLLSRSIWTSKQQNEESNITFDLKTELKKLEFD